ncbi:20S proteasome A and subunit Bs [Thalassoporum mexicanum PCC 7367]|uniref:proteasome-type protease n=1 Tax=Thalassoporum mexicanum TaxID=3457544 RepID=UPI00029FACBB|nr:proteasome-type protease [Pseudanabaena sp. PCC 7367]AFY71434.1 20S proteasome A and subunit Bs [Pseudanabaena sp. PCC 7367]
MTYCLGIITESGLVMAADSRTNAGVDYVSTYRKLFDFSIAGDRVILLATSGNLSVTQEALSMLEKDIKTGSDPNLHNLTSMYEIAAYVGKKVRQIQEQHRQWLEKDQIDYQCSLLLGGQLQDEAPELYLIYSQGNFIQATQETPFLQIGETKYGKPLLDRTITYQTPWRAAAKCALLSIDSTMKSNISVGPPINLIGYEHNSFQINHQLTLKLGAPYLVKIRKSWESVVKEAFDRMPDIDWDHHQEAAIDEATENMFVD